MPIPPEYRTLVARITDRTKQGTLEWKVTKEGASHYFVSFQNSSVAIGEEPQISFDVFGPERQKPFRFTLYSQKGEQIDSFVLGPNDPDYLAITGLWRAAHRKVMRVDEAIRQLENELQDTSETDEHSTG